MWTVNHNGVWQWHWTTEATTTPSQDLSSATTDFTVTSTSYGGAERTPCAPATPEAGPETAAELWIQCDINCLQSRALQLLPPPREVCNYSTHPQSDPETPHPTPSHSIPRQPTPTPTQLSHPNPAELIQPSPLRPAPPTLRCLGCSPCGCLASSGRCSPSPSSRLRLQSSDSASSRSQASLTLLGRQSKYSLRCIASCGGCCSTAAWNRPWLLRVVRRCGGATVWSCCCTRRYSPPT